MISKQSFTLYNIVSMVENGEQNNVDICSEPLDNNGIYSAEESGN